MTDSTGSIGKRSGINMTVEELLESGLGWLSVGAGGGASFLTLKYLIDWFSGRVDKREATLDAGVQRLDLATQRLIENLQKRLDDVTDRMSVVEHELAECRTQHAEAKAEVMSLRAMVQGFGDARQQAANTVAAERGIDRAVAAIMDKAGETK